jgi:hypothetical protein
MPERTLTIARLSALQASPKIRHSVSCDRKSRILLTADFFKPGYGGVRQRRWVIHLPGRPQELIGLLEFRWKESASRQLREEWRIAHVRNRPILNL